MGRSSHFHLQLPGGPGARAFGLVNQNVTDPASVAVPSCHARMLERNRPKLAAESLHQRKLCKQGGIKVGNAGRDITDEQS
eukprot:5115717-Pyramimonas_sp.AAC.3